MYYSLLHIGEGNSLECVYKGTEPGWKMRSRRGIGGSCGSGNTNKNDGGEEEDEKNLAISQTIHEWKYTSGCTFVCEGHLHH